MQILNLADFVVRYNGSERRQALLIELKKEIAHLCGFASSFRVLVFGSFLTEKPVPGDIDLLIAGIGKTFALRYPQVTSKDDLDLMTWFSVPLHGSSLRVPSAEELVHRFNNEQSNAEKGIAISIEDVCELMVR